MQKEAYRDYATEAFRRAALMERKALPDQPGETSPEGRDLEAVTACFRSWEGSDTAKAVRAVYMVDADKPVRRGDIVARVRWFADEIHVDDSAVYRMLKEARREFAVRRGLYV